MSRAVHPMPDGEAPQLAEAPAQEDMLLEQRPGGKPVDWESVQRLGVVPEIYDPPQLREGWMGCLHRYSCFVSWYLHRSPLLARPVVPCCCSSCFLCCAGCQGVTVEEHLLSDPDEWFRKLLTTGSHPNCPKQMSGLWWMQDNHAHETLSTFHDMDWKSDKLGVKRMSFNWTRPKTFWATISFLVHVVKKSGFRIEISPDGKWINMAYPFGEMWAYIVQEGDSFKTPDGEPLPMLPGEFFRINYEDVANLRSEVSYLYRVRRVAYLDDAGNLVKTPAYTEMLQRAQQEMPRTSPCCGNYCVCLSSEKAALKNWLYLDDRQFVAVAPPAAASV